MGLTGSRNQARCPISHLNSAHPDQPFWIRCVNPLANLATRCLPMPKTQLRGSHSALLHHKDSKDLSAKALDLDLLNVSRPTTMDRTHRLRIRAPRSQSIVEYRRCP